MSATLDDGERMKDQKTQRKQYIRYLLYIHEARRFK